MRILTNDYLSNIPGSSISTKGGPPRFASDFAAYVLATGNEWIGLVHASKEQRLAHAMLGGAGTARFVFAPMPTAHAFTAFKALSEGSDYEVLFADAQKDIEKIIDEVQPELVFLNGFSVLNWVFAKAAFQKGIPLVTQHAGIFTKEVLMYPEVFSVASQTACAAMEQEVSERARANIFLNESSLLAFRDYLPNAKINNARVIPLPHAGWEFVQRFVPISRESRVLGAVARWDRIKNHEALLALAEAVQKMDLPWVVRVVTHIPDTPQRTEFKNAYRSSVEVVDPMDREALRRFYASCDVLLLPSHFDVSPTVVMEALSAGKPTLISPGVGWASEYRASGASEWIVDFSKPDAVIASLRAQFTRSEWPELGKLSSEVQLTHNPESVYASYLALFSEVQLAHP